MKKKIKFLLVDDHKVVRQGLSLMLRNQDRFLPEIDMASNANEALNLIKKNKYDIYIYDITMQDMDGIELIEKTVLKVENPRILMFSMHTEFHFVRSAIDAGALGYVVKDVGIEELTKAIMTVYKYDKYYSNEIAQVLLQRNETKLNNHQNLIEKLSTKEIRVIKLLTDDLTDEEIAERLFVSKRTVQGYRHKLKEKLNLKSIGGLVKFAYKNGLVD